MISKTIVLGNVACCRGCGESRGLICIALGFDCDIEILDPIFPYDVGDCPVCLDVEKFFDAETIAKEADMKTIQQALFIKRTENENTK